MKNLMVKSSNNLVKKSQKYGQTKSGESQGNTEQIMAIEPVNDNLKGHMMSPVYDTQGTNI